MQTIILTKKSQKHIIPNYAMIKVSNTLPNSIYLQYKVIYITVTLSFQFRHQTSDRHHILRNTKSRLQPFKD